MPSTPAAADQSPNIFALSEAYVLGHLDEAKTKAFNALLLKDAEAREQCILAIDLMSSVNEEFRRREENAELSAAEPLLQDFSIAMNDLLRMEQQAEVIDHPFQAFSLSEPPRRSRDDNPTIKDLLSLAGYLSGKAIKSRPAQWLAAAAVVLLGITIFIALSGNTPELATNSTEQTKPAASTQSTPRGSNTVATLTATHNAVWASPQASASLAPLSPGSPLHPGTRLTLTAGFAEIMTRRGAVAILQAPATIELTDNDNALQLHSGKLVGICETPSSNGFLVRTPHMDITDLGTRFGVDVLEAGQTEVHVIEGVVQANSTNDPSEAIVLNQGESAVTSFEQTQLVLQPAELARFAALTDLATPRLGTGQGLALGEIDPDWTVSMLGQKGLATRVSGAPQGFDDAQGLNQAKWLTLVEPIAPGIITTDDKVNYSFIGRIELPKGHRPETLELKVFIESPQGLAYFDSPRQYLSSPDNWLTRENTAQVVQLSLDDSVTQNEITIKTTLNFNAPAAGQAITPAFRVRWEWTVMDGSQPDTGADRSE